AWPARGAEPSTHTPSGLLVPMDGSLGRPVLLSGGACGWAGFAAAAAAGLGLARGIGRSSSSVRAPQPAAMSGAATVTPIHPAILARNDVIFGTIAHHGSRDESAPHRSTEGAAPRRAPCSPRPCVADRAPSAALP